MKEKELQQLQSEAYQLRNATQHINATENRSFQNNTKSTEEQQNNNVANQKHALIEKELNQVKQQYETDLQLSRKAQNDLIAKQQDLLQQIDKVKQESIKQIQYYKGKYNEYKDKMRRANQSLAILTARLAKADID